MSWPLGVAVAPDCDHLPGHRVEHLYYALGRVVAGQVIARPMVEQITKENNAIGALGLDGLHQAGTPVGRPMDIGCDKQLHLWASNLELALLIAIVVPAP